MSVGGVSTALNVHFISMINIILLHILYAKQHICLQQAWLKHKSCWSLCCLECTLHFHDKHHLISPFICKAVPPPPTDIGWSMNDGGVSAISQRWLGVLMTIDSHCRLEYQ
jgi:hypothetical protein